jgi:hypothetical protein
MEGKIWQGDFRALAYDTVIENIIFDDLYRHVVPGWVDYSAMEEYPFWHPLDGGPRRAIIGEGTGWVGPLTRSEAVWLCWRPQRMDLATSLTIGASASFAGDEYYGPASASASISFTGSEGVQYLGPARERDICLPPHPALYSTTALAAAMDSDVGESLVGDDTTNWPVRADVSARLDFTGPSAVAFDTDANEQFWVRMHIGMGSLARSIPLFGDPVWPAIECTISNVQPYGIIWISPNLQGLGDLAFDSWMFDGTFSTGATGSIVFSALIGPSTSANLALPTRVLSIPLWFARVESGRDDLPHNSHSLSLPAPTAITVAPSLYWPYATSTGSPVWDTETGTQLADPCS